MVEGDLKAFTKRVKDILSQVATSHRIKYIDFLNVSEQDVLEKMIAKVTDISVLLQGGFVSAERKRGVIFPSYMNLDSSDAKVSIYQIEVIGTGKITHSQVLGSLMGLNIDRGVIGDIMVGDAGAAFAVCSEFNQFLMENFTKVGRHDIRLLLITDIVTREQKFEEVEIITSSMRLDVIVKALINVSRGKAEEYLTNGFVRLNHTVDQKGSRMCQMGDILSIRKHGRFQIDRIKSRTKRDKFVLVVRKNV